MRELLTRGEYEAIAGSLDLPTGPFINGRFAAAGKDTFETVNPATGKPLADMAACGEAEVNLAVRKAREAFRRGDWSQAHPRERKAALVKLARLMRRHRHELATLESIESGKPIRECALTDVPETVACLLWYAEAIDKVYGQVAPAGDDAVGMVVREPIGVVGCILPWNFPLMMLAWKLGPALAAGNSVVAKPAEQTSMSALRVAELSLEAGIPPGVLNVLTGPGETTGMLVGMHPDIDAVSFTGSSETGRRFLEYSAKSNLKRITLECGSKSPCIVLDDAEYLDDVAAQVVAGAFWNMGQNCTANSRLIVGRKVKADLLPRIAEKVKEWRLGHPLDPANALGSLISPEHRAKVMGYVRGAAKAGAKTVCGGKVTGPAKGGGYMEPTVLDGVTPDMKVAREEVFGPVLAVITAGGEEEAVQIANDSCYGLQASLFTASMRRGHRIARRLRAGTVSVNCYSEGDITTPFGGYKLSGFGGRDNGLAAFEQYTETKTIWINTGDGHQETDLGGAPAGKKAKRSRS